MSALIITTLIAAPIIIFFFGLWHLAATYAPPPPATLLHNKRIILLIAHPDDESMFFAPTVQALTAPHLQNHVKILCLSTGNADGLGDTRRQELEAAALTLGVRRRQDIFVLNDEARFRDGMREQWSPDEIARVLASAFAPQLNAPPDKDKDKESLPPTAAAAAAAAPPQPPPSSSSKSRNNKKAAKSSTPTPTPGPTPTATVTATATPDPPRATIDVLITFDRSGISSHPNHIALYQGARRFLSNLMRGHPPTAPCPVSLYTLTTVNIVRKYSSIIDVIATFILSSSSSYFSSSPPSPPLEKSQQQQQQKTQQNDKAIFVSDMQQYLKAREAMVHGHKSQMVWFRWGWITLGRYMLVNDLARETSF